VVLLRLCRGRGRRQPGAGASGPASRLDPVAQHAGANLAGTRQAGALDRGARAWRMALCGRASRMRMRMQAAGDPCACCVCLGASIAHGVPPHLLERVERGARRGLLRRELFDQQPAPRRRAAGAGVAAMARQRRRRRRQRRAALGVRDEDVALAARERGALLGDRREPRLVGGEQRRRRVGRRRARARHGARLRR
jgi:hypothetical protein